MGKNNEENLDFNLDFLEDNIDTDSTKPEQPIDFMPYMKELQKRIKENWTPPKMSESKSTKILFSVMKNGNIGKISILQSSGDNYFDTCAIETLKMTAPFDPIPDRTRKSVDIQFTFDYNVLDNQNVNTTIEETIPKNTQPFFNKVFIWLKKVWDWILTALGFLLILGIIGSIGFELYDVLSSHIKSKETSITQSKMEQPYNLQEQPIPPSGIIKNYTGKKRIAPFEITPSEHYNYYIKLVDANTGGTALTMFVRSGEKLER